MNLNDCHWHINIIMVIISDESRLDFGSGFDYDYDFDSGFDYDYDYDYDIHLDGSNTWTWGIKTFWIDGSFFFSFLLCLLFFMMSFISAFLSLLIIMYCFAISNSTQFNLVLLPVSTCFLFLVSRSLLHSALCKLESPKWGLKWFSMIPCCRTSNHGNWLHLH